MRGAIRGVTTLVAVLAAGLLVWLATQFDLGETGEYWAAMGIIAGAGFIVGLAQVVGGWTKWGAPRVSPGFFLLGFLPTAVLIGGILLATKPTGQGTQGTVRDWADTIGITGFVEEISIFHGVLAFAFGLVLSFVFDTAGPRDVVVDRDRDVLDEEVHDPHRKETVPVDREVVHEEHGTTVPGDRDVVHEERVVHDPNDRR